MPLKPQKYTVVNGVIYTTATSCSPMFCHSQGCIFPSCSERSFNTPDEIVEEMNKLARADNESR